MTGSAAEAWAVTLLCCPIAALAGARLAGRSDVRGLVDHLLHLAMAAGMIGMSWSALGWWRVVFLALSVVGTAWYLARAVRSSGARALRAAVHAGLMLFMVWMLTAMPASAPTTGHHRSMPVWTVVTGLPLVAGAVAAAAMFGADAVRSWRSDPGGVRAARVADVAMCAGMVVATWPMLLA